MNLRSYFYVFERIDRRNGSVGRVVNSFCAACGTTLFFAPTDRLGSAQRAAGCGWKLMAL